MFFRRLFRVKAHILAFFLLGLVQAHLWSLPIVASLQKTSVAVVSNPRSPIPRAGKRKRIAFKEELRIGQREGDENYMFGSIIFVNADEDGNLYVTDWDKKRILKYDATGNYLLTIGREGQGPRELLSPTVVRFDNEGNLYVTDLSNRRISFFNKQGSYLRQILVPAVYEDLYITAKGSFLSSQTVPIQSKSGVAFKVIDGVFNNKFELETELSAREVISKAPSGTGSSAMARYLAAILSETAFQPTARHFLAGDGTIYFGSSKDYAIDVFSPDGQKAMTIRRVYDPIKVLDKDKEYFAATVARPLLTRPGRTTSENEVREILGYIEYPKYKPAYQSFSVLQNGWLVVIADVVAREYSLFDIFDKNGRYIGQFKADFIAEQGLYLFKNEKAYAVETDEEGYKFVKRYGMEIANY